MNTSKTEKHNAGRRVFLKKMAYVAPTIVTVSALASIAAAASGRLDGGSGIGEQNSPTAWTM